MLTSSRRGVSPVRLVLVVLALPGCADDGRLAGASPLDLDDTAVDAEAGWDPSPSHHDGDQVRFVNACALLAEPRVTYWTLVDADAHAWILDEERSDPGLPASWIPSECHGLANEHGKLTWSEDGDIVFDTLHEASPSELADMWLGEVRLDQVEMTDACREVFVAHDAWLPALSLVRADAR
jgi:hypothetical protein